MFFSLFLFVMMMKVKHTLWGVDFSITTWWIEESDVALITHTHTETTEILRHEGANTATLSHRPQYKEVKK